MCIPPTTNAANHECAGLLLWWASMCAFLFFQESPPPPTPTCIDLLGHSFKTPHRYYVDIPKRWGRQSTKLYRNKGTGFPSNFTIGLVSSGHCHKWFGSTRGLKEHCEFTQMSQASKDSGVSAPQAAPMAATEETGPGTQHLRPTQQKWEVCWAAVEFWQLAPPLLWESLLWLKCPLLGFSNIDSCMAGGTVAPFWFPHQSPLDAEGVARTIPAQGFPEKRNHSPGVCCFLLDLSTLSNCGNSVPGAVTRPLILCHFLDAVWEVMP